MDYSKSGYRLDLEKKDIIESAASGFPLMSMVYEAPEEIDPRPWHVIENQSSMGSCQGHARTSVSEMAYHILTGSVIQFSEMFAYLTSQKIDGLLGSDKGSTIHGGMEAAKRYGECPVNIFPYPNPARYSTKVPNGAWAEALKFRIRSHTMIRSYADTFNFLSAGLGGIEIGIGWNGSCTPRNGTIESYSAGGGGHALAFLGYSKRRDQLGRKYLWLANSWDVTWGNQGWAEVSPNAVDQMCRARQTVMIGLSDLQVEDLKPRKIDWVKESVFT